VANLTGQGGDLPSNTASDTGAFGVDSSDSNALLSTLFNSLQTDDRAETKLLAIYDVALQELAPNQAIPGIGAEILEATTAWGGELDRFFATAVEGYEPLKAMLLTTPADKKWLFDQGEKTF
jgi:hypothetical protein